MPNDFRKIKSRADFLRALEEAGRIAFSEQSERFADPEWKRIVAQLEAMKRCTSDGRSPTYSERVGLDLDLGLFTKNGPYAQTIDRGEIATKLLHLENYFKTWPEDAKPDETEANQPTQTQSRIGPEANCSIKAEASNAAAAKRSAAETHEPTTQKIANPAKHSTGAKSNKSKSPRNTNRFLLNNSRAVALAPLFVAVSVYWAFHRIAPKNSFLAKVAAILMAVSLAWLALFTLYAFAVFLRRLFSSCPRCHHRFGMLARCRSCGIPRAKIE